MGQISCQQIPVIVVGPPRSGTTMTARVLQEWLGVLMDGSPRKPDHVINPYGWFEDHRIVEANTLFLRRTIKINAWTRRFKRFIRAMEKEGCPWGFKDPRIIPLLGYALSFFNNFIVIRCHRPREWVVKSYIEKLHWSKEASGIRYDRDEKMLDQQLSNIDHIRINFDKYITTEKIIKSLSRLEFVKYGT